jgi:AcrR family transcriptional regulator
MTTSSINDWKVKIGNRAVTATVERIDRRRLRTRAALLHAGKALFAERPVDSVTIDDIVATADVAKGSFYNHFPDKDALARSLADLARVGVEATVARVGAGVGDPAERVARALCAFARDARERPLNARMVQRLFPGPAIPHAAVHRRVRADIAAGLQGGRFSGLMLEAAVLLAVGCVNITVGRVLERHDEVETVALAQDMAFGLLRGLGVEPAEARDVAARAAAAMFGG